MPSYFIATVTNNTQRKDSKVFSPLIQSIGWGERSTVLNGGGGFETVLVQCLCVAAVGVWGWTAAMELDVHDTK